MAYTALELKQYVEQKINASRLSTWKAQDEVSYFRGLHHKYDHQLVEAVNLYKDKGQALIERYKQNLDEMDELIQGAGISIVDFKSDMKALVAKVLRLADKYWAVRYEIEGRQKGFFVRKPKGTTYYIDFVDGLDTNDGLSITTAWKTTNEYTTTTVRTIGDIAWVRANRTEILAANVVFDEDGNGTDYIHLKGCSIANDPWGDASDVRPILDFNNDAYNLQLDGDDFWHLYRLDVKNSAASPVVKLATNIKRTYLEELIIQGGNNSQCLSCNATFRAIIKGGEIKNSLTELMRFDNSFVQFIGVTFNAASAGQNRMVQAHFSSLEFIDCSMGQTYPFTNLFLYMGNSKILMRNTKYIGGYTGQLFNREDGKHDVSWLYMEDKDQAYGDGYINFPTGTIEKDTAVKMGNATFSLKMSPSSLCAANRPFILQDSLIEFPFQVKLSADVQKTLTIKLQANAWTAFPTADQLYIEASYYSSATTADRATIKSTQVISQADTWTDFSVTLTPLRDGIVYINAYLKKYEAAKTVNVNGEVVIT